MDGLDRTRQGSVVFQQFVADQGLVEVYMAVHEGGEEEPPGAVLSRRQAGRGARANRRYSVSVDDDVGDLAARQKDVPQSPHGRLP
jgi:hypothetical protein